MRRRSMLVIGLLVSAALVAAPSPAQADYDLTVTWPENPVVNTDHSTYDITISDTGPGELKIQWWSEGEHQGPAVSIPHNGTATLRPGPGQGWYWVERCLPACDNTEVMSPTVYSYNASSMPVYVVATDKAGPGDQLPLNVENHATIPTGPVSLQWKLFQSGAPDATVGVGSRTLAANFSGAMSVNMPQGLSTGSYNLEMTFSADPGDGVIVAVAEVPVEIDATAPQLTTSTDMEVFFPAEDGFRDKVLLSVTADEPIGADFYARPAESSDRVLVKHVGLRGTAAGYYWNGKLAGESLPAGDYVIEVDAWDTYGNHAASEFPVRLDAAVAGIRSVTRKFWPVTSEARRFVGSCSRLVSPSPEGWRDSFALNSGARCTRTADRADDVVVDERLDLPVSLNGQYGLSTLQILGGAAPRFPRSRLKVSLVDPAGKQSSIGTLSSGPGWYTISGLSFTGIVRSDDAGLFVVIRLRAQNGNRFDLGRFSLVTSYTALVEPDGTIIPVPE